MKYVLVCCLALLGTGPAAPADYLNGDWFILTGKNVVSSSDPTGDVAKELAKGPDLKCLAFTAEGAWSFLFGGTGIILSGGTPASLGVKIPEFWKITGDFRCLAFRPQGGWIFLYDKNGFAADGIPASLRAQLQQVQKAGETCRSIAFTPDGGWVLLLDEGFREEGLPKDLRQKLADHYQQRIPVRCVAFTSQGDWFLLDGRNAVFSSNPNHPAYKKLAELRAQGQVLKWVAFSPGEYTHGYVLEHQPVQRIKAVLTLKFDRPEGGVDTWVVLPPQAPELPRQRDVKVTLEPESLRVPDTGPLQESVLLSRVHDRPKGFTARAINEMTLYTNRLVPRAAGQAAPRRRLPPELVAAYTRITDDIKTKAFQDFLDKARLRRGPKESDMALARRTFLYIAQHFAYQYPSPPEVVEAGKGDCFGLSWVFVRALRANGVPARLLLGRWAESETPAKDGQPPDGHYHVKPEFFADGVGWVGADMSGGVGVKGNPFVCFGTEAGDFVVLDLDVERVAQLLPGQAADKLNGLQGMAWWWFPSVEGKDPQLEDHWTVEVLDRQPAATRYRPSWKRPPPSGPHTPHVNPSRLLKLRAAHEVPGPAAVAPVPPAATEGQGADFPWLILAGASAGLGLLVLLLLRLNRRYGG